VYLPDDIKWNILGEDPIIGKKDTLKVSKILKLKSFPIITIKTIIAERNFVVIEVQVKQKQKKGKPTIKLIVTFLNSMRKRLLK
jgi:hypothetical protein